MGETDVKEADIATKQSTERCDGREYRVWEFCCGKTKTTIRTRNPNYTAKSIADWVTRDEALSEVKL